MAVIFSYADKRLNITGKRKIKEFVALLFKKEGRELDDLTYVFCSDEYLLDINRRFLQHDYYTDIITFDLSEPGVSGISGEIYISLDRVQDNARLNNVSILNESIRVIAHGALHLCGYKDKTKREISKMREREEHYLRLFSELYQ